MYNIDQHVPKPDSVVLRTVQDGVLGCSMGMLATCFNAPFDVVKSRLIQNYGYDDESATDVLNYVASIFARGDVKES